MPYSSFSPKAAWLLKRTCTMCRVQWQARFFVLLETELRYYKDEHAVTPTTIFSLQGIDHVRRVTLAGQTYCLSFEPIRKQGKNGWILAFSSDVEMQEWHEHILKRLDRRRLVLLSCRRRGVVLSSLEINQDMPDMPSFPSSSSSTLYIAILDSLINSPHRLDRESASSPSFLHHMHTSGL